ncbi:MAG: ATP-dependent DNA ligase [Candidatus Aenigmarchaeota archaeon]|nr:ATP-dependent DNA ligase [Candidatus Aenigmarchaeota archaeon]
MKYSVLADNYEKLESTSGKIEKTNIISKLLKKTPTKILSKVVLLLSGKVFPAWSEEELGVANQLMIKSISKAYGINEKEIVKEFKKTGDLGLVVEKLSKSKKQTTLGTRELDMEKVFENLQLISKQTGSGSQDRKMNLIAELLTQAKPKEAKYIVRTVLGQLRIGVAEGIIRDAVAGAFNVSAKAVENAWFLNPDYGEIAKIAKEKGEKGLKKVKVEIGRPIVVLLAEKAPSLKDALSSFDESASEYKYDGARMLVHKKDDKFWIFTRRLENITKAFPDVIEVCKESLKAKECIVDGEGLAIDKKTGKPLPFQSLSQRIKRKYDIRKISKEIPIELNFFDIIYLNGKPLFDLPLKQRRKLLAKTVKEMPGKVQLAKQLVTNDLKKADKFYKRALKAGQEGLIVKNLQAKYQPGRRVAGGWLKVKPVLESLDLVIIGATWGTGKRAGWLGSFILACRDPNTGDFLECGMLGTGVKEKKSTSKDITFKDLTEILKPHIESEKGNKVKIKPKIVIEVAYEEIQKSPTYSSGYALRFPRLLRVRWDMGPAGIDALERIERIFKIQKGRK